MPESPSISDMKTLTLSGIRTYKQLLAYMKQEGKSWADIMKTPESYAVYNNVRLTFAPNSRRA